MQQCLTIETSAPQVNQIEQDHLDYGHRWSRKVPIHPQSLLQGMKPSWFTASTASSPSLELERYYQKVREVAPNCKVYLIACKTDLKDTVSKDNARQKYQAARNDFCLCFTIHQHLRVKLSKGRIDVFSSYRPITHKYCGIMAFKIIFTPKIIDLVCRSNRIYDKTWNSNHQKANFIEDHQS